jgi:sortase A
VTATLTPPAPASAPPTAPTPPSAPPNLPFWLKAPRRPAPRRPRLTPRDPRWWVGVVWLLLTALLLGFVGHVALFGILQHARTQAQGFAELRTSLAKAETPLGQLGIDKKLVPAGTPVALLQIPKLGMKEVVRQGTSPEVTRLGAGHSRDTPMPGQAGTSTIMGRQATYGGPFGNLAALVPGDRITVITGQGTHTYTVFGIRRPGDPLPQPIGKNAGRLQLVTSDGLPLASTGVLYIDAALKGTPEESSRVAITSDGLDDDERVMGADAGDWLPLVFAFQWLVVAVVLTRWLVSAWGRWQTWLVAVPVLLALSATTADQAMSLLPNLI